MRKDTRHRPGNRHKIVKCPLHLLGCHKTMRSDTAERHIRGYHQRIKEQKRQCEWCLKFFHPRSLHLQADECHLSNKRNKAGFAQIMPRLPDPWVSQPCAALGSPNSGASPKGVNTSRRSRRRVLGVMGFRVLKMWPPPRLLTIRL